MHTGRIIKNGTACSNRPIASYIHRHIPGRRLNNIIDKLGNHCKDNNWTTKQVKRVAAFAEALPGEMMISLWNKISSSHNLPNIQKIHKLMGQKVVSAVQASRNVK